MEKEKKSDKECFICGTKYTDSILGPDGESNFCHNCRRIRDKFALRAIANLAQQLSNLASCIDTLYKKIKENK